MTTNVNGTVLSDILIGNSNPLDIHDLMNANWSAGDDTMAGGTGNDTYQVNSAGDVVLENAASGTDTVISRINSYTLTANVEKLTLDNTLVATSTPFGTLFVRAAVNGTGNDLANVITGNDNSNTLSGLGGNDTMYGRGGNDTMNGDDGDDWLFGEAGTDTLNGGNGNDYLSGGDGNDTLNGGFGNDTMVGGLGADAMAGSIGNDTYYVDNAGDTISEGAFLGGTDQVYASVSHWLAANVENLTLTGTAATGIGNASNNVIIGNASANSLSGLDGNDTLKGGAGNDTVSGGNGNDELNGETGLDLLTGGAGADKFVFTSSGVANADSIGDFSHADDTIVLGNALDAGMAGAISPGLKGLSFGGNVVGNTLSSAWYFEGVGLNGAGTGLSGIYNNTLTGEIWYDPTSGIVGDSVLLGRVNFAIAASLDHTDFVLGG
jgi:serralysin